VQLNPEVVQLIYLLTVQKIQNVCLINALTVSVFLNDENPIVNCDSIYRGGQKLYMYCGKAFEDVCQNDDECSSKECYQEECYLDLPTVKV